MGYLPFAYEIPGPVVIAQNHDKGQVPEKFSTSDKRLEVNVRGGAAQCGDGI
jgi:hypothetical protein